MGVFRVPGAREGVGGVGGMESAEKVGDSRLYALLDGRKIPAPRIDVVKYRILCLN